MNNKRVIKKYIHQWMNMLGLGWWNVTVNYYDDPATIIQLFASAESDGIVIAKVSADWKYGSATLSINLPAFEGRTEDDIERIVVHELVHILVNEMREGEIHHEERVVTGLTKAFLWTRYLK